MFDTHTHLFMEPLSRDINGALERAFAIGVERLIVPSVSISNWAICGEFALLPGISCALGVHPWWAEDELDIDALRSMLLATGACAIGEIGLDWKTEVSRKTQFQLLQVQLELAVELDLPVILHCRGAFEELLGLLEKHPVRGVMHSWSRDAQLMQRFLKAGLHISFGGAITRSSAKKARVSAAKVPFDRFILETDSPSTGLAGVPSGKSEPMHIAQVAEAMAEIRGEDQEAIQKAAWKNSVALFGEIN